MSSVGEILLWALLLGATFTDYRQGKIYNVWVFPFMAIGCAFHLFSNGFEGFLFSLAGITVALLFFIPLYALGAFAAGDVKLLMAVGALGGVRTAIQIGAMGIVVGAVVGVILLVKARGLRSMATGVASHLTEQTPKHSFKMPFAPAFLCALLIFSLLDAYSLELF